MIVSLLFAASIVTLPARPPDGTYTYSIGSPSGPSEMTSTVVVKSAGATFDISENAKLPNGAIATTTTTWSSATLLPTNYEVRQGKVDLRAVITPSVVTFTGPPLTAPLVYKRRPQTQYMVVYEGLNAFRMMLPYFIAAHPGETLTVVQINGNQTEEAGPSDASPFHSGPAGDTVSVLKLGKDELVEAWRNPKTGMIDEEFASPGNSMVKLVRYAPASP